MKKSKPLLRLLHQFTIMVASISIICILHTDDACGAGRLGGKPDDESMKFALAISGGVSLGSYEAGLNWAFIKHLKNILRSSESGSAPESGLDNQNGERRPPRLVAITGASAGSINALMSVISWCIDEKKMDEIPLGIANSITSNIYRETWLNIGIDELLPTDRKMEAAIKNENQNVETGGYEEDDLLFSRKAFGKAIANIEKLLSAPVYRRDCNIPFAFTLTRIKPETIETAGIKVENSRFVIPMRLIADPENPGRVIIVSSEQDADDPFWGNVIYLPGKKDGRLDKFVHQANDVVLAMQASSSFPIVFGSKRLRYCLREESTDSGAKIKTDSCPQGFVQTSDYFLDGGVFDNVPLGTAKALAEPRNNADADQGARINYIYLDPGKRRNQLEQKSDHAQIDTQRTLPIRPEPEKPPLMMQLGFLGGAINTGLNYELYNVLRSGEWNHRMGFYVERIINKLKAKRPAITSRLSDTICKPPVSCVEYMKNVPTDLSRNDDAIEKVTCCLLKQYSELERTYTHFSVDNPNDIRKNLKEWMKATADVLKDVDLVHAIDIAWSDPRGERLIILSSRYFPLTGDFLNHFGAFLEDSFRALDYYVGIYDAVHDISDFRCSGDPEKEGCIGREAKKIYESLGIFADPIAGAVFSRIACVEHPGCSDPRSSWYWIFEKGYYAGAGDAKDKLLKDKVLIVMNSLQKIYQVDPDKEIEFSRFIRELSKSRYPEPGFTLQEIIDKKDREQALWYYPITSRASLRLKKIADQESDQVPKKPLLATVVSAGMLAVNTLIDNEKTVEWSRSTVPSTASWRWNIIPYEISADLRNGGWFLSWEPRLNMSQKWALDLKITSWIEDRFGENIRRFAQADLFLSYKKRESVFSSFGLGPSVYEAWQHYYHSDRIIEHVGASGYIGLIGDKLRLTIGVRSLNENYYPAKGDDLYITMGMTDLSGIAYWFLKGVQ